MDSYIDHFEDISQAEFEKEHEEDVEINAILESNSSAPVVNYEAEGFNPPVLVLPGADHSSVSGGERSPFMEVS